MEVFTYSNSAELCENLARYSDTVILSFSRGKDSIAAWLQLRKYFKRIIPVYYYDVPHISIVDESIKYYEEFFGTHIYQFPASSIIRLLIDGGYCSYRQFNIFNELNEQYNLTKTYTKDGVIEYVREKLNLDNNVYHAVGIRATDSPSRRMNIKVNGAVHHKQKLFYPVYDWTTDDIVKAFDESGVKLPKDYDLCGCTLDGEGYKFIHPMREKTPEDFELMNHLFSFLEVEIARYDGVEATKHYVRGE